MSAPDHVYSRLAENDLEEIALHIAADSPNRALSFVAEIRDKCRKLAFSPAILRVRDEYGSGVRVAVHGNYLIFYMIRDETMVIERILHGAQHLDWVKF